MVLHDDELDALARAGAINPYNPERLQPASIDLTLGTTFRVLDEGKYPYVDLDDVPLDLTYGVHCPLGEFYELWPGQFLLGRTAESINVPTNMVGRLEGKSSLGRLGLIVHVTAGFFDPGFMGFGTLEFVNLLSIPIRLRPGKPICQFTFHHLTGEARPYNGRYRDGNDAEGSRYGHDPAQFGTRWLTPLLEDETS